MLFLIVGGFIGETWETIDRLVRLRTESSGYLTDEGVIGIMGRLFLDVLVLS